MKYEDAPGYGDNLNPRGRHRTTNRARGLDRWVQQRSIIGLLLRRHRPSTWMIACAIMPALLITYSATFGQSHIDQVNGLDSLPRAEHLTGRVQDVFYERHRGNLARIELMDGDSLEVTLNSSFNLTAGREVTVIRDPSDHSIVYVVNPLDGTTNQESSAQSWTPLVNIVAMVLLLIGAARLVVVAVRRIRTLHSSAR